MPKASLYDYAYDKLHRLVTENLSGTGAPIATKVETIPLDYAGTGPVHAPKIIDLNGVSRTCTYDANGNMVVSPDFTNATNPLNRAITYDGDNMPTRIVHANGATVDFVYDGVSKRTKKIVASGKTVLYLGDHYEVENGVSIRYIFGGNLRLAQIKGSLTSYFHKDHLGSTAAVTDASGLKIESTTYEPFGATRDHTGDNTSAYKFTDQELDNETGLYNYDARLYDPVLGMFVTPDSIVPRMFDPQNLNRYAYCRNNPLIYVDPSGHTDTDGGGDPVTEGQIPANDIDWPGWSDDELRGDWYALSGKKPPSKIVGGKKPGRKEDDAIEVPTVNVPAPKDYYVKFTKSSDDQWKVEVFARSGKPAGFKIERYGDAITVDISGTIDIHIEAVVNDWGAFGRTSLQLVDCLPTGSIPGMATAGMVLDFAAALAAAYDINNMNLNAYQAVIAVTCTVYGLQIGILGNIAKDWRANLALSVAEFILFEISTGVTTGSLNPYKNSATIKVDYRINTLMQ